MPHGTVDAPRAFIARMAMMHLIAVRTERLIYRIAALPTALRARHFTGDATAQQLRRAVADRYWRPADWAEWLELGAALVLWPIVVPLAVIWFSARNGPVVRRRGGKGVLAQAAEQLRLYFAAGILAPWYYIFELHDDGVRRVPTFLQRSETKWGVYLYFRPTKASPLSNKAKFAERCRANTIRCVPTLLNLDGRDHRPDVTLPDLDLFVKFTNGRGGKGAERWDRVARQTHSGPGGLRLPDAQLLDRWRSRARERPLLVQPRLEPHPELAAITSGALPTVRALTCLDEQGEPEVVAAVFRLSIGGNRTVDNIHAGGVACGVALDSGVLGKASNLGMDARLGWHSVHPDTGAPIEGRVLPFWSETKALAEQAHRAFADRTFVGWDLAILADGPIVIEGNGSPDVDLMQRFMRIGFCEHRFGELLAWHLKERGYLS